MTSSIFIAWTQADAQLHICSKIILATVQCPFILQTNDWWSTPFKSCCMRPSHSIRPSRSFRPQTLAGQFFCVCCNLWVKSKYLYEFFLWQIWFFLFLHCLFTSSVYIVQCTLFVHLALRDHLRTLIWRCNWGETAFISKDLTSRRRLHIGISENFHRGPN